MYRYIFVGSLIQERVGSLFYGVRVRRAYQFRVTRNSDLYLDNEERDNLLKTIELERARPELKLVIYTAL